MELAHKHKFRMQQKRTIDPYMYKSTWSKSNKINLI
jgi:hypothetical protein